LLLLSENLIGTFPLAYCGWWRRRCKEKKGMLFSMPLSSNLSR